MAEPPGSRPQTRTTTRCSKQTDKRKKSDEQIEEEEKKTECSSNEDAVKDEELNVVKTKNVEWDVWKPLVFSNEEDGRMLALQVVIEHVSSFDDVDHKQHFLFLPHKLSLRNLTHTVLHKVGFRNLDKYTLEGRLQIGVLKPLSFSAVTDNLEDTIGHLLMSIISNVILYIKVKKMVDDTNEEERLEYREIQLMRGTGYLISDYTFVVDRQSDRKDILYLRCSRQRKGDCPSRAKILRELGCAVVVNKNHNHPPPNVKMQEFMHRCRNESREPKNFTRHLKDVYDEICDELLSKCSPDDLAEAEQAIQDWDAVKKIMQKCRSRAVCSTTRQADAADDCQQSDATASIQNNSAEKIKRLKLVNHKTSDVHVNGDLPQFNTPSTVQNFTTLYQGHPPVTSAQLQPMIPAGVSLPSGSAVAMMADAGTVDGITNEPLPAVGPIPLICTSSMSHQGYTGHHYYMNSNWTTTPDNFMLNVQTTNTN